MKWLQREVEALQIMMQSKHARPTAKESSYWDAPFETPEQKTARMFPRKGQKDIGETEERVEDSLRSFPITLPRLIEPSVQNAALQAGDWLTQVRPLIADTSTKAGTWWDQLLELTMRQYGKWLEANPLERLQISPPQESELPSGHERLEQRITNMLLAAVPTSIKDELIATRQLTPQGILFKVLRVYQPGGLGERASILSALTNTREATSAQEAVEDLRLWHRQLLRTCELKAALPDPTLLIAALDQIMRQVLAREVQATFRVNTFRMNNSVDVRPSRESVLQFYEVLLAEAETLVGSASNAMAEGKSRAVVKALVGSPHKPERTKPCSFWGTETGCRYGKNCRLVHTLLEDRNARCWNCSATTHRKAECPFLSREGESTQPTSRGSGEVGDGRGGEGKSGSKGKFKSKSSGKHLKDGKESAGEKSNDKGKTVETTSATSRSSATATTTGDGKGTDQASAMKAEADTHQQGSGETADTTKELLTEMTGLLRSLRITEPQMKVCQVMKISGGSNNMTLLDGGATHCLRKAGSDREWKEGKPIVVKLASGHAQLRQNQDTGTLLTQEDVQALIPVGKLIDIGCQLTWTRDKCRVEHLTHGVIPVELQMGCPMVDEHWGTMLMQEVEDFERRRARVRAVLACGLLAEGSHEKRVAELCSMYPQVPHRILERIPGEEEVDMVQVPLNRRQRRKIQRAEAVIIHMYSGPGEAKWRVLETMTGVVTLCFDLRLGHNVMDGHLAGYIQSIIDGGKVVAWLSGPPCRTVSACPNDYDNGPPRLRDGDGEGRFGREGLTVTQQEKADVDTVLYLKNLTWIREVLKKNPQASIVLEQPRDPQEWRPQDGGEQPSFLRWPETRQLVRDCELFEAKFDQGALGHKTRKPTTVVSNLEEVKSLHGMRATQKGQEWPADLTARLEMSADLAEWAPGLVEAILDGVRRQVAISRSRSEGAPEVCRLAAQQRRDADGWRRHCQAGHLPYRRDCEVCLECAGKDRPRRRVPCPESFCLGLDLMGPFREGKDQEVKPMAKYAMVGTLTIPIDQGAPMVQGLRDLRKEELPLEEDADVLAGVAEDEAVDQELRDEWEEPRERPREDLDEREAGEINKDEEAWKQFLKDAKRREVRTLTFAVPLASRKAPDVVEATAKIMTRIRALQVPIIRVHTDRAKEFVGGIFKNFIRDKGIYQTYTSGDEPTGNARTERAIGWLKERARVMLRAAGVGMEKWPLAIRQAAEETLRAQLRNLGIPTLPLLRFGAKVLIRRKTWHRRGEAWGNPMEAATAWGPAGDMSISSKGYFLETNDGKFLRSTVVVQPEHWGDQLPERSEGDQARLPVEAEAVLEEGEEIRPVVAVRPEDRPRRRLTSKTRPRALFPHEEQDEGLGQGLSLRRLREGGEHTLDHDRARAELENAAYQHRVLKEMVMEDSMDLQNGRLSTERVQVAMQVAEEAKILEQRLEIEEGYMRAIAVMEEKVAEVLQTRTVHLDEVKANLERWKPAFQKEYDNLVRGPVTPITAGEYEQMQRDGIPMETLPGKAVATEKPTKLKARIVVCGNYTELAPEGEISAGGACPMTTRVLVHKAALQGWSLGSLDVTGAFLQAPRRTSTVTSIVDPPQILRSMNITAPGEKWKVNCALYGFVESPADWGDHRDKMMTCMEWTHNGQKCGFRATPERHLWEILEAEKVVSLMVTYVDDFLGAAPRDHMEAAMAAIRKTWECSDPEWAVEDRPMRYCGYDIQALPGGGFSLSQGNYIKDLVRRRGIAQGDLVPMQKVEEAEDEEEPELRVIREAQAITGELSWVAQRTRPDVAYSVGFMSRLIHRRPQYVVKVGQQVLRYLWRTQELGLIYRPGGEEKELQVSADASFGPSHEKFRSIQGIVVQHAGNTIQWETSRQPFVTQSTCEAELMAYNEAYQVGEAMSALMISMGTGVEKKLFGDSKSALTLCSGETGHWRTRHLRLRAAKLREAVRCHKEWEVAHRDGVSLVADGLTKPLQGQAFQRFVQLMNMRNLQDARLVTQVWEENMREAPEVPMGGLQKIMTGLAVGACCCVLSGQHQVGAVLAAGAMLAKLKSDSLRRGQVTPSSSASTASFSTPSTATGGGQVSEGPSLRSLRPDGFVDGSERADGRAGGYGRVSDQRPMPSAIARGQAAMNVSEVSGLDEESEAYSGEDGTYSVVTMPEPNPEPAPAPGVLARLGELGPWNHADFYQAPRGQDRWRLDFWAQGWLIRVHGKSRHRSFMPLHSTCPCEREQLGERRVTVVMCGGTSEREVVEDVWGNPRHWERPLWKGYTFFAVNPSARASSDI